MGTFGGIQVNVPHTWTGLQTFDGLEVSSGDVINFLSDVNIQRQGVIRIIGANGITEFRGENVGFASGIDMAFSTGTGSKIGISTTQKFAFWNATPVVQPGHIADPTDLATAITALELILADLAELGLQAAS